jgi:hypothetical protein
MEMLQNGLALFKPRETTKDRCNVCKFAAEGLPCGLKPDMHYKPYKTSKGTLSPCRAAEGTLLHNRENPAEQQREPCCTTERTSAGNRGIEGAFEGGSGHSFPSIQGKLCSAIEQ